MPHHRLVPGLGVAFAVAELLTPAGSAWAQAPTYSCSVSTTQSNTEICTISPGSFNAPLQAQIPSNWTYSVSSAANIGASAPAGGTGFLGALEFSLVAISGTDSSSANGGNGSAAGQLQFTSSGYVNLSLVNGNGTPFTAYVFRSASQGGDGGNYTNTDAKHSAGIAGAGSTVNLVNSGAISFAYTVPAPMFGGAVLLAESLGGQGGSVTSKGTDQNGNPQYGSQTGTNGASAGAVTLTNSGTISNWQVNAIPNVMQGYWSLAGRSLGGDGGTGNNGQAGGSAGQVEVTTTANVSVAANWFTPSGTPPRGTPTGIFGMLALSQGGNGTMSVNSGNNGGPGGSAGAAVVTVTGSQDAPITISASTSGTGPTGILSAAVGAVARGGNGGAGYNSSTGGSGGSAGAADVSARFATITATGDGVLGLLALSRGGIGGNSGIGQDHSRAGAGGASSIFTSDTAPNVTFARLADTRVTTSGSLATGVAAIAQGGAGGTGQDYTQALQSGAQAGMGGAGGAGGAVRVEMLGGGVTTTGIGAPAILGLSRGGAGGNGGDLAAGEGDSGAGGAGGAAGTVFMRILGNVTISTSGGTASNGDTAFGINALSQGGAGGAGGAINVDLGGSIGNGGAGGNASDVTVQLGPNVSVRTNGAGAIGVAARSLGGAGGAGSQDNSSGGIATNPGDGGASGNSGAVTVQSGAAISTAGQGAHGILALSISGTTGSGGNGAGIIYGPAGSTGASGTVGPVSVTNSGGITTQGQNAIGIQAQSIGGGSGTPGATDGGFFGLGGSSSNAASGNTASVIHSSSISTAGQSSIGVLVQSIGGGGGNGGNSNEVIGSYGGSAGGGGSGAAVTGTLTGGTIVTQGDLAHGFVAQSIGGGGGSGGNATATGTVVTMSYGGTGGDGGTAGPITLSATGGSIGTFGTNAAEIVAQAIGGGGGAGGSAYSTTGSVQLSVAVAIGASGGNGGDVVGPVSVGLSGTTISTGQSTAYGTNTNPVDAFGIVAQSIGGGGGMGGSAMARAVAAGLPNPESGVGYTGSLSLSIGGSGGTGGSGGPVSATLQNNATITTQGQGSHGLLLQSIGGGGGAGGDSSTLASTVSYGRASFTSGSPPSGPAGGTPGGETWSMQASISIGGDSQYGGHGGSVSATLGPSTVTTLGDYANAIVAQSVGGGGGNGGIGSSNTQNTGSWRNINMSLGLGGKGGAGGDGGIVTISQQAGSLVQTYGSGAHGIVAQSLGGGGGTSQGGGFSIGGVYSGGPGTFPKLSGSLSVQVGATGGNGGAGQQVSATIGGSIRTSGGDASGVVLQSIGGGGGIGGAAGTEASSDNPILLVSLAELVRTVATNVYVSGTTFALNASVSVGGSGGAGGNGSAISFSQSGSIATQGDWSMGAVLQSIGGGGGKGGVATSSGSGLGLSTVLSVGGSGGSGGTAGLVSLSFAPGSSIATGANTANGTSGYGAFGVLAQSIGGSGGLGVDGSIASQGTIRVGATLSGSGGGGGDGSPVNLTGTTTVTTLGDVAAGIVMQSIGGGGGVGGNGSSLTAGLLGPIDGSISIAVGGSNGIGGNGNQVQTTNTTLTIATSGANAYGILAQSIGGGGGFGFSSNIGTMTTTSTIGAQNVSTGQAVGNGGSVSLSLTGGSIRTSGLGSHGIVAQSIGGGGGIAGLPTAGLLPQMLTASQFGPSSTFQPGGAGGSVTITSTTPITTTGDFAHGILAQSVGGGGGLVVVAPTVIVAGTSSYAVATGSGPNAPGGTVTITQSAPISATGANSIGIFAQSSGSASNPNLPSSVVSIAVNAAIQGGSGNGGLGIGVDSFDQNSVISISSSGSVSALSGNAIRMTYGTVFNYGTVTGSYSAPNGFNNYGTLNAGASLVAAQLDNAGTLRVGAHVQHGVSRVSQDFVQRASGRMLVDADFGNRQADMLVVAGDATLAGRVRPLISSVLPNINLLFMTVQGTIRGMVEAENSTLFSYRTDRKDGGFTVTATAADFTPPGYSLRRNIGAVAGHLQAAWDAGGNLGLGPLFALLGNTADAGGEGAYSAALRQISPNASFAPGARVSAGARAFANAALSCPQFEGTTAMLREGECVWATLTGRTAAQSGVEGIASFRYDTTLLQAGGQRAMGGGWFLGGSLAYENSRLSTTDGLNSGRGQAGYGAVTAKYQTGPWLFSGAVFGGAGTFNNTRTITLPGFGSIARGSPTLANVGGLLRATYTLGGEELYLRPSVTMSLIHARSSAWREGGAGVLNLDVASASSTVGAMTPALEVGGRVSFANGVVMRLFTSAGVSLLSNGQWSQESRLLTSPVGARFETVVRTDQVVGRVTAGAQVFATDRLEVRLQYDGEYSSNLTGHGGSLSMAYRF